MNEPSSNEKSALFAIALLLILWTAGVGLAASGAGMGAPLFPEIPGWKLSDDIQVFSPKNLYDYIDGGADLFLKYDFQELRVAEYQNDRKTSVTAEVYRHRTPVLAFGIYSQERLPNARFLDIGAQGYGEPGVLNFLAADCYVKLTSVNAGADDEKVLLTFAGKIAERLGGKGGLPAILASFPAEGMLKNSEKLTAREFLGYSFFHSGFTADYELAGKKFQLFVIEGRDRNDCRNMLQSYLKQAGSGPDKIEEGRYNLKDPYHGEMDFYWQGRYIRGALNLDDAGLRAKMLKLFGEALEKQH
ncbi:MAG: hypothetical protein LLG97_16825 [Deltaproteobacteria bacterium]|nr:hypothetical protein [Deltaproteobacteria bacterium]